MNQRAGLTLVRTSENTALALVKGVRPTVSCAWCGALIAEPKRGQRWCTPKHRVANSEARRAAMAGAVHGWLVACVMKGLTPIAPTVSQVEDALDYASAERRARLMKSIGLVWVSEKRRWIREK